ncbi:MAG: hypothetical protein HEQ10_23085 [Dolichospermum sp. DEX182a]|nr:hypothetical protein [Dolichospermum sp. DEX182a]
MRLVELSNSSKWENIYSFSVTANYSGEQLIPIPPFSIPIFLESDIIAIYSNCNIPKGKLWNWAGTIEQIFNLELIPGTRNTGEQKSLYLKKLTTLFFPPISAPYSLKIRIPRWFPDCYYEVWQYTGKDISSEEELIKNEFQALNLKIDQLLN